MAQCGWSADSNYGSRHLLISAAEYDALYADGADSVEVVSNLAEDYWDCPALLFNRVMGAKKTKAEPRAVHKVAIYYSRIGIGGGERVTRDLIVRWASMGYEVVLLTDEEPSDEDYELPPGVKRVVLPQTSAASDYRMRAQVLSNTVADNSIDAFVYAQWLNKLLPWDVLLLKAMDVPVVIHTHGVFSILFSEPMIYYRALPFAYRIADGVVCLSEVDGRFWKRFVRNTYVTPNSLSFPFPSEPASLERGDTVLWLGRLEDRQKCPRAALEIIADVRKMVPGVRLLMVGPADADYRKVLEDDIESLNLTGVVELCGPTNDIQSYYRRADVFLMTSRFEGFPLTLSEAQAMGLPCVMYDLPYLTLTNPGYGIVTVPFGSNWNATKEIADILLDKSKRKELGQAARDNVEHILDFDYAGLWNRVFKDLEKDSLSELNRDEKLLWDSLIGATLLREEDVLRESCALRDERDAARSECDSERCMYDELAASTMLRVGKAVTAPARKFKDTALKMIRKG